MIKRRGLLHFIVCSWILSLYVALAQTSALIISVKDVMDATELLQFTDVFLVRFVRVIFDYGHMGVGLVFKLIGLISIPHVLLLILAITYYRKRSSLVFSLLFFGPIFLFMILLMGLSISMASMSPISALSQMHLFAKGVFTLSLIGSLSMVLYWALVEGASVDTSIGLDYNGNVDEVNL